MRQDTWLDGSCISRAGFRADPLSSLRTADGRLAPTQRTICATRALFAVALLEVLWQRGLAGTQLATAQFGTIREHLLKVAATVRVSVRRI